MNKLYKNNPLDELARLRENMRTDHATAKSNMTRREQVRMEREQEARDTARKKFEQIQRRETPLVAGNNTETWEGFFRR